MRLTLIQIKCKSNCVQRWSGSKVWYTICSTGFKNRYVLSKRTIYCQIPMLEVSHLILVTMNVFILIITYSPQRILHWCNRSRCILLKLHGGFLILREYSQAEFSRLVGFECTGNYHVISRPIAEMGRCVTDIYEILVTTNLGQLAALKATIFLNIHPTLDLMNKENCPFYFCIS